MKKFVVFILALISFFSLASYVSRIDDNNLITRDEVSAFASEWEIYLYKSLLIFRGGTHYESFID